MVAQRINGQGAPDLAAVLRSAGLRVDESAVPDWRNRSRSGNTSWYTSGITGLYLHDTASSIGSHDTIADEIREARACAITHEVKPVSNIYLGPSGTWYPLAGGPSNTNGLGRDTWHPTNSQLWIPDNSANSRVIAIEAGNNGVGEPWPQLEEYLHGCAAIADAYGISTSGIRAHHEWAPTRKIDLSGGDITKGAPLNRYMITTGSQARYGKFNMDLWRRDVDALRAGTKPPPPPGKLPDPYPKGGVVLTGMYDVINNPGVKYLVYSNGDKIWVSSEDMFRGAQLLLALNGRPTEVQTIEDGGIFRAMGTVKAGTPNDPRCDIYGMLAA